MRIQKGLARRENFFVLPFLIHDVANRGRVVRISPSEINHVVGGLFGVGDHREEMSAV